jgi:hypothetical protein
MADIDLTGKIKQAPNITAKCYLQNEAADALGKMAEAYKAEKAKDLPIVSGYVSPFDIILELYDKVSSWGNLFSDGKSKVQKVKDALSSNGTVTKEEVAEALTILNGVEYDDTKFTTVHAMHGSEASDVHPSLKGYIQGWPNRPQYDPRRSGLVIVLTDDQDAKNWVMTNGFKFGWLYYTGPFDTFTYIDPTKVPQDGNLAKACGWGVQAVLARMVINSPGVPLEQSNLTLKNEYFTNQGKNAYGKTPDDDFYRTQGDYYLWKWTWRVWNHKR